ncbi:MAG TPA: deoxyguanosinetriphosphate triphosphohydrolase [Jatrophihabitans sp.]|nr:deoxyguanosinetriphosphate triphosphohydrolase [Jatrophihabitans sp.]
MLSPVFEYSSEDRARLATEEGKREQGGQDQRSAFQRDRARVLHSYAFRRLADKTQVVSPGQDDFPRTRLTHSLEVAQIGREMGAALGCDPDIVDAAGLAHDLGHPPFGHNGEDALDQVAAGCGGFEGNAQTLRILTRLEAKAVSAAPGPAGLNLTRAVLDAVCKYPWPRRPDTRKFGVYESDRSAFDWVRAGSPGVARCLEAQVMDWADDVAYSVHDVEDGVHAGHIRLVALAGEPERIALCEQAAQLYSGRSAQQLLPALERLLALPPVRELADYDGSFAAQGLAKRATSELTGRFVSAAVTATRDKFGTAPLGRYAAELVVPAEVADECALLKAIAYRYVMSRRGVTGQLAEQRRVLTELVAVLLERGAPALSPVMQERWYEAAGDAHRLRVVIDQVAQLTDSAALTWHQRLLAG